MQFRNILLGLAVSVGFAATAQAGPSPVIWVDNASFGAPIIQEYDTTTGALLTTINAPHGNNGRGMVTVGNTLYYTDSGDNHVYGYNFVTHTDLGTVFTVSSASALSTIAYDGTNFWIGDYSGTNHAYLYSPTGTLLKTISLANCTGNCDGLEYGTGVASINGGNPFLISNRADEPAPGIYDVYDLNGNLLISGLITDAHNSTGIAFDGSFFYVDNGGDANAKLIALYDVHGNFVRNINVAQLTVGEDLSVDYSQVLPPAVPEPASITLLGAALVGFGLMRRRRKGA